MERKFDEKLLDCMQKKQYTEERYGVPYIIKPVPEDIEDGMMDPRVLKVAKIFKVLSKIFPSKPKPMSNGMLKYLRKGFNTAKSLNNWNDGVVADSVTVPSYDGYAVPVMIYKRENAGENLPILYYIHGGGFFGGSAHIVEQMCKFVAQKYDCLVFNVDYRLCPENHYPQPIDDCYSVLEWIYKNAEKYGGNKEHIAISGDSAGGNVAVVCTLKDRDNNTQMVKMQYLLYPTVNMAGKKTEFFEGANLEQYNIHPKHTKYLKSMTKMMGMMGGSLGSIYLQGYEKEDNPYVSPIFADLSNLPPTNMYFGEHDFLYPEDSAYARHLLAANNKVNVTLYKGMGHGFVDQMGVNPQAEDLMSEIAKSMKLFFEENKK